MKWKIENNCLVPVHSELAAAPDDIYGQYLVFRCMGKEQKNMKNYKITDFEERISRKLYKISICIEKSRW